jgi:hypothetical protein
MNQSEKPSSTLGEDSESESCSPVLDFFATLGIAAFVVAIVFLVKMVFFDDWN